MTSLGTSWRKKSDEGHGPVRIIENNIALKHQGAWHDAVVYMDGYGDKFCVRLHDFKDKWERI